MQIIKTYYKTTIWVIIMLYLLFTPASGLPKTKLINIPHSDKIIHAGMFAIFVIVFLYDSYKINANLYRRTIFFLFVCIVFGIFTEYIQYMYIEGRYGNIYDTIADFTGSIIGVTFFFLLKKLIYNTAAKTKLG